MTVLSNAFTVYVCSVFFFVPFDKIGRKIDDVDGIFVTHEHSDHIKGLGVIARKYGLPVYANEKTWKAMENQIGKLDTGQKFLFPMESVKSFGGLDVESFGVSHDAAEPMFYVFHYQGRKLADISHGERRVFIRDVADIA